MHTPLRYATDQLLMRAGIHQGLDGLLADAHSDGKNPQVVSAMLTQLTEGVIIVDRRTVARWMADAKK